MKVRFVGRPDEFVNGHPQADHDSEDAEMLVATGLYVLDETGDNGGGDGQAQAPARKPRRADLPTE